MEKSTYVRYISEVKMQEFTVEEISKGQIQLLELGFRNMIGAVITDLGKVGKNEIWRGKSRGLF